MLDLAAESSAPGIAFHDHAPDQGDFAQALIQGLAATRKAIPCRFLYDARGSALFDRICDLEEYYPTRTEIGILREKTGEIARRIGPDSQLIELGGASSLKAKILLDALERPGAYVPIDISREHLRSETRRLHQERPWLAIHAVCADYARPFALPRTNAGGRRLGFFPGSTIGNLQPDEALAFLADWAARLGPDAAMVIGVDLRKSAQILERAYDDAQGVTAAFTKNVLARANQELGADFDLALFAHRAHYDADRGRIEIHLESLADQTVRVLGHSFTLKTGERIHVEDSCKYSIAGFRDLARAAGFIPAAVWTDPAQLFSVHYLQTPPAGYSPDGPLTGGGGA
jgi:dimethylhistidine N-methyltransferase